MSRQKRPPDFEKSLAELESLVEKLEGGDLSLEESLKSFERGVKLTRECQTALETAEAKVEILLKQAGGESLHPFEEEGEEEGDEDGNDALADDEANDETQQP